MVLSETAEERFWSKVRIGDGCWEWAASKWPDGYAAFSPSGAKSAKAHRVAWVLTHGPIPDGMLVCHRCDNRGCVRPGHLFLGTHLDNNRDRSVKGRSASGARHWTRQRPDDLCHGEKSPNAILTASDVVELRHLRASGMAWRKLAERFGCSPANARAVVARKSWKHVP